MNLSKSGPSLSVGMRGAHVTVGRRGVTRTVGLPGTGVYYTSRSGHHTGVHSAPHFDVPAAKPVKPHSAALGCLVLLAVLLALAVIGQVFGGR